LYFNSKTINFVTDKYLNLWFYARQMLKALEYIDEKKAIKRIIKHENKEHIANIYPDYKKKFGKSMQPKI